MELKIRKIFSSVRFFLLYITFMVAFYVKNIIWAAVGPSLWLEN